MALESGARIGGYEILAAIGSGGMGEVYRARDLTLGREVAVKVLPESFGADEVRLSRFRREAKLLAALNHPNIAAIHGLDQIEGTSFLVLELVPGRTLAEKLRSGPLPFEEARAIFLQIARALEAAHEKGIIHRDLKPENVRITGEGTVKLLDFGLGKEVAPQSRERTDTYRPGTSPGLVMGTPAYMSPEQARGLELSKTTDIWSFGVCLFETLSGKSPFARQTLADTHSAILNDAPPWSLLPRELSPSVAVLLQRCLRKKREDRLHDIGDARLELEEASPTAVPPHRGFPARSTVAAAMLVVLGLASLWWLGRPEAPSRPPRVERYSIELPPTAPLSLVHGGAIAVSNDGSRLVYASRAQGRGQLFLRPLAELEPVPVPGSEGAVSPFFSPSGDRLAFFADGTLRRLSLPGGTPASLAEAPSPRGGAWTERGEEQLLVFSPSSGGTLALLSGARGTPVGLTALDASHRDHRWPAPLPGGEAVLFTIWNGEGFDVAAVDLASGEIEPLVPNASYARFAATGDPGHLVFARGTDLHAVPFEPRSRRLLGEPALVVPGVAFDPRTGASFYDVSPSGTLFYAPEDHRPSGDGPWASLLYVDESGRAQRLGERSASIQVPRLSPDDGRVAMTFIENEITDIWTLDLERDILTRLTFEGNNGAAVWTPDGARIIFSSDRAGPHSIFWTAADGSGEPEGLTRAEHPQFPTSVSPDGHWLLYTELHPETTFDVWLLSLEDGTSRPLLATEFEEAAAVFSPDGSLVAYASNESGVEQVYVRRFPGPEGRLQVSSVEGTEPVWAPDGKALFFRSGDALMVAEVTDDSERELEATPARRLFEGPFDNAGILYANYDVTADGRRFVMIASEQERTAPSIQVVVDWFSELGQRVPGRR